MNSCPTRLAAAVRLCVISAGLLAVSSHAWAPSYAPAATLARIVNGQALRDYAFDRATRRLFAGSDGLFWFDLDDRKPTAKGPIVRKDILRIELAPESGRLFYLADDEIGFVDIRHLPAEPVTLAKGHWGGRDIAYEPTRQEVFVGTRSPAVLVFNAVTGERLPDVTVPGWYATGIEAIPGRVFMNVEGKSGVYQIDAATHNVTPWAIDGRVVTPARLEADPAGRTLFAAYDQYIVAIDVRTAKELGRIVTAPDSSMAFDPGTGWLVASWVEWQHPLVHLSVFSVDASGFNEVGTLESRVSGGGKTPALEPTNQGFIQLGSNSIIVWKALGASH